MNIALVYDRVNKIGGAEQILLSLHKLWPRAPLFTSVYHPQTAKWAKRFQVLTSPLQKIPLAKKHHEWFAWATPYAFESFDFSSFDIVISVTSAEAKGIITSPNTLHISYLLTPTRYLWSHAHFYQNSSYATNKNFITKKITPIFASSLRRWDYVAAQRPDHIVAISQTVATRIKKYYQREADQIIYPPVIPIKKTCPKTLPLPDEYYLVVSRLVPYKQIDIAIKAFNQSGKNLVIVGTGAQEKYLKQIAKPNITFLNKISRDKLTYAYNHCQALIFPAEEDFGIVSVEAQSAGKPVIAYSRGGSKETVISGQTGILYTRQTPASILKSVEKLNKNKLNAKVCRQNAKKFSQKRFLDGFKSYIETKWDKFLNQK